MYVPKYSDFNATERVQACKLRPGDMIIDSAQNGGSIIFIVSTKQISLITVALTMIHQNKIHQYYYYNEDSVVKSVYR